MHRSWENTAIGTAWVMAGELRLETNSTRRADALRARVEVACGDLVRHRERGETDPRAWHRERRRRHRAWSRRRRGRSSVT